jgi:site-specific DNA recombinase
MPHSGLWRKARLFMPGHIESQVVILRRQIAAAGQDLVREYIDDGYTGTLLTRPGLEQLRSDLKTDLFDVVHFLAADRIARHAPYQSSPLAP